MDQVADQPTFTRSHGAWCPEPYTGECKKFSTDGSRLGADIAHTFGTTDEEEIKEADETGTMRSNSRHLTGMDAEQAEWESEDGSQW